MEKTKHVKGTTNSMLWGVKKGQICRLLGDYFYNGETFYKLIDMDTGKRFDSPTVFWKEV